MVIIPKGCQKMLASFRRTSTPEVFKDDILFGGWLTKKGGSVKNWKRRFFVLTAEKLLYYEDDTQIELRGYIG